MSQLLAVALNGRSLAEHPEIPRTPTELARAAWACVEAGAQLIHFHAYDDSGEETLAAGPCASALSALRVACPGIPLSLTTSAAIEPDPERRFALISAWTELPDMVTANQGEAGTVELCKHLIERGVGIEAGLLQLDDAYTFAASGLAVCCERVLVEPLDADPGDAVTHAEAIEGVLADAVIELQQVHHGDGIASWAVCQRAVDRGHGIRTGLEDTVVLPDGQPTRDNSDLVRAAAAMLSPYLRPQGNATGS